MKFVDQIRMARGNLRRQKGRTRLTMTSIVIGAFAVIAVLTITFAANSAVTRYFESTGRMLAIDLFSYGNTPITDAQVAELENLPGVERVSPRINLYFFRGLESGDVTVRSFSAVGELPNGTTSYPVLAGRELTESDEGPVALIAQDIARAFVGDDLESIVGTELTLVTDEYYRGPNQLQENCNDQTGECEPVMIPFTVAGVIDTRQEVVFSLGFARAQSVSTYYIDVGSCEGYENYSPGSSCENGLLIDSYDSVADFGYPNLRIRAESVDTIPTIAQALVSQFGMSNQLDITQEQSDQSFVIGREDLQQILSFTRTLSLALLAIGGISLLVSAIGVINTMLMATLERTREIGVMRAIGASRSDITRIFTVEAGLLGFLGGVWGLAIATIVLVGISLLTNGFETFGYQLGLAELIFTGIAPASIVVGLTTLMGILSGVIPARRAARMNPVDSLRYE